jgi:hypothetical protein
MAAAFGWGALAASSLLLGVLLAFLCGWPTKLIGAILAFGAGALISAVSFELSEEGIHIGSGAAVAVGLALGAAVYYLGDGWLDRRAQGSGEDAEIRRPRPESDLPLAPCSTACPSSSSSESAWPGEGASASLCWWRFSFPICPRESAPPPR